MAPLNRQLNSLEVYRFLFHAIAVSLFLFAPVLLRVDADMQGNFSTLQQIEGAIISVLYLLNVYLFIPKFLKEGKYIIYIGSLALTFTASIYLMRELFRLISVTAPVLPEGIMLPDFAPAPQTRLSILPMTMALALGICFEMILNWEVQRKEKIQIEKEKMSAELLFLKSQVNPHFLFNSLNSVYALSEQKSERTGDAILLLSNLMRYMLYGSNNGKTEIGKEVDCIENYIQLQRLRISARDTINIQLQITGRALKVFIEPLILLPFIENAFKHGVSYNQRSEVSIKLDVGSDAIEFHVRNTKKATSIHENPPAGNSGIGLANVKRRLNLLYQSRHSLVIDEDKEYFAIHLRIHC